MRATSVECHPLTPDRWDDLERLFGPNGASSGCWCMYWRLPGTGWSDNERNRASFHERVDAGPPPGLLAYRAGGPVGWVQVAPRIEFPRLDASRHLRAVDDAPVWCVNCFFVHRTARRQGVAPVLLAAAVRFAGDAGAKVLEAYPVERAGTSSGDLYTGTLGLFRRAGFSEVARRHPSRPIVRFTFG